MCGNPTLSNCLDQATWCITAGVGRLATFPTYADFSSVTSAFGTAPSSNITIGITCSNPASAINEDPAGVTCTPSPISFGTPSWPNNVIQNNQIQSCVGSNSIVTIQSQWNHWVAVDPNANISLEPFGYMCEFGKIPFLL